MWVFEEMNWLMQQQRLHWMKHSQSWHYHTLILSLWWRDSSEVKWSDFWATQINNKLHSVQPTLGCGSLSNRDRRREQLVLCRLRLGHTYITHMYLLAGEDPPLCISCQENLTVEHILIHCAEYFDVLYQCFDVNNLGELFLTVSPNIIIHFIRRAWSLIFDLVKSSEL